MQLVINKSILLITRMISKPNWSPICPFIIIYHHAVFLKLELTAYEVI